LAEELAALNFHQIQDRLEVAVAAHAGTARRLSNGTCVARFGDAAAPRLAVLSGVHGDERSGPLALLSWLEGTPRGALLPSGVSLWTAPLLNDAGWEQNTREWKGINLNAAFLPQGAPPFLQELMADLAAHVPGVFIDLHEDSEKPFPYVYRYVEDRHGLAERLQQALAAQDMPWTPADRERWKGSTEIYVRQLGCDRCATIEAPPAWPLARRVAWNLTAVSHCLGEVSTATRNK
jgi:predicted deacylase